MGPRLWTRILEGTEFEKLQEILIEVDIECEKRNTRAQEFLKAMKSELFPVLKFIDIPLFTMDEDDAESIENFETLKEKLKTNNFLQKVDSVYIPFEDYDFDL